MKAFEYGPVFCSCSKSRKKTRKCQIIELIYWKWVCDMIFDIITSLILPINKTRIGWLGSDWTADWIGLWIRSNWIDIFAFGAEELFWGKLFLIMTQMALNKKSEFSQQESNLWLVKTRLGLNYILVGCPCLTQVALRGGYGISCIHRPFHLCL